MELGQELQRAFLREPAQEASDSLDWLLSLILCDTGNHLTTTEWQTAQLPPVSPALVHSQRAGALRSGHTDVPFMAPLFQKLATDSEQTLIPASQRQPASLQETWSSLTNAIELLSSFRDQRCCHIRSRLSDSMSFVFLSLACLLQLSVKLLQPFLTLWCSWLVKALRCLSRPNLHVSSMSSRTWEESSWFPGTCLPKGDWGQHMSGLCVSYSWSRYSFRFFRQNSRK